MASRQRVLFGAALSLLLALPAVAARAGDPAPDEYIARALRDWEVPGLALAVVKDDAVVMARGYGLRRLGAQDAVDHKTVFGIASCSKAFTAAALGMLVDDGKLSWDDPARKHLHDFQLQDTFASREITVRDLLCHRSGLPRYDLLWYGSGLSRDEVLRRLKNAKATTSFRSQFGYQNMMFLAAGQVVPAVSGKSWDEVVRQRIFQPLGMTSSSTSITAFHDGDNLATPHQRIDDKIEIIPWRNVDNVGPAASINSCAADMAQWIRLQLKQGVYGSERLLTTKAVAEMHSPQSVLHPEGMGPEGRFWIIGHPGSKLLTYGFGWVLREYGGQVIVQHCGYIDGMRTLVVLIPEKKLGFVIMTNRGDQLLPEAIGQRILDSCLDRPERDWSAELLKVQKAQDQETKDAEQKIEKERLPGTKPSLAPEKYAGTYQDDLYGEVTVASDKGKLSIRCGPALVGKLEHWHRDTFRVTWADRTFLKGLVTFRLDRKGDADEVKIALADWDDEITAKRAAATATEPVLTLKPDELRRFVGVYQREAPPLEITVEWLDGKLKLTTFGQAPATLLPIKSKRFRVEGATVATYVEFELAGGKIKQVVYERGDEPKATLLPKN